MKIKIINDIALESLLAEARSEPEGLVDEDVLACDGGGGCGCDTGSDWILQPCGSSEWINYWKKATC